MPKAKGVVKKGRRGKNLPSDQGGEEQKIEIIPDRGNGIEFENELGALEEASSKEINSIEGHQLVNRETEEEVIKNENGNLKEESRVDTKSGHPKRIAKSVKDIAIKTEEEIEGAKGKRRGLTKTRTVKEEGKKGNLGSEEVTDGCQIECEKDEDNGFIRDKGNHGNANKSGNKRRKQRKMENMKENEIANDKKVEEKMAFIKDGAKMVCKRGGRVMKRIAEEKTAMDTDEVVAYEDASSSVPEDLSDFRCTDHIVDETTKSLHFKLSRGRKMKLLTSEEAKDFAMETCFDYMMRKITEM